MAKQRLLWMWLGVLALCVPAGAVGQADGTLGLGLAELATMLGLDAPVAYHAQGTIGQAQGGGVGLEQIRTSLTDLSAPGVAVGAPGVLHERIAAQEAGQTTASAARAAIQERLAIADEPAADGPTSEPPAEPQGNQASLPSAGHVSEAMHERLAAQQATKSAGLAAHAQLQEGLTNQAGLGPAVAMQEQTRERLMARLGAQ